MFKRLPHYLGVCAAVGVFAGAVWALSHQLRDLSLDELGRQLDAIPAYKAFAAILVTFAAYLVLAAYDMTAFRYIARRMSFLRVAFVSSIAYAFSHNLGFGALTGGAVRYRFYTGWGVSAGDIARVVVYAGLVYYLCALSVGGLLMFPNADALAETVDVGPVTIRIMAAVWVLSGLLYIVWCARGSPIIRLGGRRIDPPKFRHGLAQFCVGMFEWALTSATLYLVLPPEIVLPYWHFLAIYVISYMAGYISHVPGGLGVFEAVLLALMPGSVPTDALAAGVITYRAIYFLLPLMVALAMFVGYEVARGGGFLRGK